jgi:hypothetical protein
MFQIFVAISQKFYYRKEACGYAKVILEKRKKKRKSIEKWASVQIIKTMGT